MRTALSDLESCARRLSRRAEEADDLLQSALLAAVEAGRTDLSNPETRRWLKGVIRNQARQSARTAVRRRRRETQWADARLGEPIPDSRAPALSGDGAGPMLAGLPPSLQITALLALNGCTREEIGWLLGLSATALRQRISHLKRTLSAMDAAPGPAPTPAGPLAYGQFRQRLLTAARRGQALASHDPDGHLFLVAPSQNAASRQRRHG